MVYQLKTFRRLHFCLKKVQLISNVGDCENMNYTMPSQLKLLKSDIIVVNYLVKNSFFYSPPPPARK